MARSTCQEASYYNATNAKRLDTRQKDARGLKGVENAQKIMKQKDALSPLQRNVLCAMVPITRGMNNAPNDMKKSNT